MNILKSVIIGTGDKIVYVVNSALEVFQNVLSLRLGEMKRYGGTRELLDLELDKLFDNIIAKS